MFLSKVALYPLTHKLTFVVLGTVFTLSLLSIFGRFPFLELTTHFRLQYVIASVLCLVSLAAFQYWRLLPVALGCALFNFVYVAPFYLVKAQPSIAGEKTEFRIFHANLYKENDDYEKLLRLVDESHPDIVVLQELTPDWEQHTRVLRERYAFVESAPRPGGSGMAILSRFPLDETRVLTLDASTHIAIFARVNVKGTPVSILGLHPPTPMTVKKFAARNQQFAKAAELLNGATGPKVLIGDLNTSPWSPYFKDLLERSGMRDSRLGFGLKTSWPMPLPGFMRIPIDHCLISEEVGVQNARIGKSIGSDHRPLIVDLAVSSKR